MKTSLIFNNFQKVKLNLLNYSEKEVEVTNSSKRKGGGVIMTLVLYIEASRRQRQEWLYLPVGEECPNREVESSVENGP